ncbi:hypothetical protein CsSME_00002862 [Camellia sinensis var. sinensis]
MAASSVVCTWLVAACMSVACEKDQQQQPMMMMMNQSSSKRFSRWARKRRVLSKCRADRDASIQLSIPESERADQQA